MGHIGILPLALAALAILAQRDRTTWTLLGVSGVAFVLSLGIYSVPHGWLTLLPGFDLLRARPADAGDGLWTGSAGGHRPAGADQPSPRTGTARRGW